MSQMLVGIDVSLCSHHVHFMHGEGHTLADFSVSNDTEGANTLLQKLLKTAKKISVNTLKLDLKPQANIVGTLHTT